MNSKRALLMLMINQKKVREGFKLVDLKTNEKVSIEECYEIVMEDLEKLEQENKELKEQVNHFKKVIQVMQNPSKLDCTHMFDNCKELKPLPKMKEDKITSLEALRNICYECERHMAISKIRCPFRSISNEFCEEYDLIEKDLEILEIIKKHKLLNYVLKNEKCANMYHLSKEEIDLLREIEK